jgi:hypothetical protein
MKYNKLFLCLSVGTVLFYSCQNADNAPAKAGKSPLDSMMEIVMHGHDEGMSKMGRVEKAAQELSHKIDSLQQAKKVDQTLLATWKSAKTNLDLADSSMNKWMDEFDMDMPNMDSSTKVQYLQSNIKWVSSVADSLGTALKNAEEILKK